MLEKQKKIRGSMATRKKGTPWPPEKKGDCMATRNEIANNVKRKRSSVIRGTRQKNDAMITLGKIKSVRFACASCFRFGTFGVLRHPKGHGAVSSLRKRNGVAPNI